MANQKVPQLPILTASTGQDLYYVVDVNDPTDDPTGSSKQITRDNILKNVTGFTATTISATTYQNLPTDVRVTGGTYSNGTATFTNNTGGTFTVTGFTATTAYSVDYIDFNTGATVTQSPGRIYWDSGTGTLNVTVGDTGTGLIDLQVGQEEIVRVFNDEATTLQKGELVYVFGSQGNRPSVKRAQAQGDLYSVTTLGMVDLPIASGAQGYVTTFGIISNLNTLGLSGGTPVWLSPTTPGAYTSTKPQAPDHTVLIGYVVRESATVGSIFINISNGWELDELHDVRISAATEGDLLVRSSFSGVPVWVNTKTLPGSYTITGDTNIGGNLTVTGNTILQATTASTLNVTGNTSLQAFTGTTGTINGNLTVTGNTTVRGNLVVSGSTDVNWFSANTSTDLVRITQTGSGNALVVEDAANPDTTPFVVDGTGNLGLGVTPTQKLQVGDGNILISNTTNAAGELRLAEPSGSGSNYTAFKAQAQAADVTYTLPASDGSSGQVLSTNGSGTLSWATEGNVLLNIRSLTSGTVYTPTAGTTRARVILIGGGGGGGGASTATATSNVFGACGGAGGYVEVYLTVTAATYSYSIGGAGSAGAATPTNGTNGGDTTFTGNSATVYTAAGGGGGVLVTAASNTSRLGGAGGTGTNGTINVQGQRGSAGGFSTASNLVVAFYPGQGGSTAYGWGGQNGAPAPNAGAQGNPGSGFGAGGGGGSAHCNSATARSAAGGAGSAGAIIIYEYK